ncbi:hypothetical protein CA54_07710 [Symmachiella macrocystis]|uniref:Uncharacterized protein n=1 Tax=Symmachiella macrocystis TaxID=2527985 RepID=A0A5C6BLE7_9PLAN|nr:hypothetical protein CA54_07710 [Symmachiella macrocystis]
MGDTPINETPYKKKAAREAAKTQRVFLQYTICYVTRSLVGNGQY